jgi:hypothetical protein
MKNKINLNFVASNIASLIILLLLTGIILDTNGQPTPTYGTARNGKMFQIFQFPRNQMPRIDGDKSDWDMVPKNYTYGTDLLNDTEDGKGTHIDPKDLDVKV